MKVKVYTNRLAVDYKTLFSQSHDYFAKHGVNIQYDFEETNLTNLQTYYDAQVNRLLLIASSVLTNLNLSPLYDYHMFCFNGREFAPNIPASDCILPKKPFCNIGTDELNPAGLDLVTILHEQMHALTMIANFTMPIQDRMDSYRLNFYPDDPNGNFAEQWGLLAPWLKTLKIAQGYKFFSQREIDRFQLKSEMWSFLDTARGISDIPYVLTSGLRTPAENTAVGGAPNSAHLYGLAADIACSDNVSRYKIIKGLQETGLCFIEIAAEHIHADILDTYHQLGQIMVSGKN